MCTALTGRYVAPMLHSKNIILARGKKIDENNVFYPKANIVTNLKGKKDITLNHLRQKVVFLF